MSDYLHFLVHDFNVPDGGHSEPNIFGGMNYFDDHGHFLGQSHSNASGGYDFFPANTGTTDQTINHETGTGSNEHSTLNSDQYTPGHTENLDMIQKAWYDKLFSSGGDPLNFLNGVKFPPLI